MRLSLEIHFITDVNTLRFPHVYDIQPPIALLIYLTLHIIAESCNNYNDYLFSAYESGNPVNREKL